MISEEYIASIPESPGVYLFRDKQREIIYVGKAKNLRDRVRTYFREGRKDGKTQRLIARADDVSFVLTGSEKEAFLLENNLIKEHKPRYNVVLKDDKTYVSLKLTLNQPFPLLTITRRVKDDGALYFGPYPSVKDVKDVLKVLQSLYPLRRCRDSVFRSRTRPCILFQLGKCLGPCTGKVEQAPYRALAEEVADFLMGRDEKLLKDLERAIDEAARSWRFEEAREKKERYLAVKRLVEKQRVHEHHGRNRDAWAFLQEDGRLRVVLLSFRSGVLIGKRLFKEVSPAGSGSVLTPFLFQYYSERPIPDEVVLSEELEELELLQQYLREKRGRAVRLYGPSDYRAGDMIKLAVENLHEPDAEPLDGAMKRTLRLRNLPRRIEVYDNSHFHGANPSGTMVVFEDFKMRKDAYRVFHIRQAPAEDDVAMMAEVLRRRLTDDRIRPLPDLIVIDGGKGHLSRVLLVEKELRLTIDLLGIAKGPRRKRMDDLLYLPLRKNPLLLPRSSPVFKQIVRMRDEAHRFALTSHRRWKKKEDSASPLEKIKGIGKKRRIALLREFSSMDGIREAGVESIARLPGFSRPLAEEIIRHLEQVLES